MHSGEWNRRFGAETHRLRWQTLRLVDFSTIVRLVAEKALIFGVDVVVSDSHIDADETTEVDIKKPPLEGVLAGVFVVYLSPLSLAPCPLVLVSDARWGG